MEQRKRQRTKEARGLSSTWWQMKLLFSLKKYLYHLPSLEEGATPSLLKWASYFTIKANKPAGLWEHPPSLQALRVLSRSVFLLHSIKSPPIYLFAIVCRLCTSWLLISRVLSEFDCVYLVR